MELRLVDRKLSREHSFPFKNESKRVKGFGFVRDKTLINYGEDDEHIIAIPDICLSEWKQEDGMCYLTIVDSDNNIGLTYAWSEKDFNAFIVNDNGKTVDRISS